MKSQTQRVFGAFLRNGPSNDIRRNRRYFSALRSGFDKVMRRTAIVMISSVNPDDIRKNRHFLLETENSK